MLTAGTRRPGGYTFLTGDTGVVEGETFTCGHCGNVRAVKPACSVLEAPDLCRGCMTLICAPCATDLARGGGCVPFLAKLEAIERRDRFRRQLVGEYR